MFKAYLSTQKVLETYEFAILRGTKLQLRVQKSHRLQQEKEAASSTKTGHFFPTSFPRMEKHCLCSIMPIAHCLTWTREVYCPRQGKAKRSDPWASQNSLTGSTDSILSAMEGQERVSRAGQKQASAYSFLERSETVKSCPLPTSHVPCRQRKPPANPRNCAKFH